MHELISIIIPVYNRETVLRECVGSILAQTHQNYEIILIDDGSTDATPAVCHALAEEDPRVIVLEAAHGGVSAARNLGLGAARGEFVFLIDSDDVIHPRLLEALVAGMKGSDAAIAGTAVVNVSEKHWHRVNEAIARDSGPGETTYQNHEDTLRAVFYSTSPINLIGGVMIRRDLIGETKFRTDLHIGEDFYFVYENLIKGASTVFLKQKWYYCRIHANNSSWDYSYSGFWTRFYRRELVWKSEESFGRTEYANCQKRNVLGIYMGFLKRNGWRGEDSRKMRQLMKDYRSILMPAFGLLDKLKYCLSVYFPAAYLGLYRIKARFKKHK